VSYCEVRAEIGGVVGRRNVNPGTDVQAGQQVLAVRSVTDVWVDANFKETQLADLRIGRPVDVYIDLYGGRRAFRGRVAGFSPGTGSTLACCRRRTRPGTS
jgi:membrane fusion protein (multidrug efflux system)